jgi:hypothetical protein
VKQPACRAQTKAGVSCKAPALPGRETCLSHTPELAATIHAARMRGGTAAARVRVLQGKRRRLEKPAELAKFLSALCEDTLAGHVDASVARSVAYVAQVLRGVVETAEIDKRLAALEATLAQRQQPRRFG